jgi:membrane protease YdiL (CAAX protease family)
MTHVEVARVARAEVATVEEPAQLTLPNLVLLFLLPGALATLVYVLLAPVLQVGGYPALAGLLVAIALVIIPFELAIVLRASNREHPGQGLLASVPYRAPIPLRDWLWLVPVLLIVAIVGFGILGLAEPAIRDALFGWVPGWFKDPLALDAIGVSSPSAMRTTLVAFVVLNAFAGPIVEELYFRGYLLPRMSRYGRWAPLLNASLFSLYHFWSPWGFLSRIAGVTPFAYAVMSKRNVYLGMVIHVALNTIGTASVVAFILPKLG